jgi:hypothetical protein
MDDDADRGVHTQPPENEPSPRIGAVKKVAGGVPAVTQHIVMRGVPLKAVQELLGHASIEMTMRYAHLSPSVRRDAVQVLDGPAAASGQPNSGQMTSAGPVQKASVLELE